MAEYKKSIIQRSQQIYKNPKYVAKYHEPKISYNDEDMEGFISKLIEGNKSAINKFIMEKNFVVNLTESTTGRSLLHYVITSPQLNKSEQLKIIKFLVNKGASVSIPDNTNVTPLHTACKLQLYNIVQYLLEKGCNPNAQDDKEMTPLHYAVQGKSSNQCQQLRERKLIKFKKPIDIKTNKLTITLIDIIKTDYKNDMTFIGNLIRKMSEMFKEDDDNIIKYFNDEIAILSTTTGKSVDMIKIEIMQKKIDAFNKLKNNLLSLIQSSTRDIKFDQNKKDGIFSEFNSISDLIDKKIKSSSNDEFKYQNVDILSAIGDIQKKIITLNNLLGKHEAVFSLLSDPAYNNIKTVLTSESISYIPNIISVEDYITPHNVTMTGGTKKMYKLVDDMFVQVTTQIGGEYNMFHTKKILEFLSTISLYVDVIKSNYRLLIEPHTSYSDEEKQIAYAVLMNQINIDCVNICIKLSQMFMFVDDVMEIKKNDILKIKNSQFFKQTNVKLKNVAKIPPQKKLSPKKIHSAPKSSDDIDEEQEDNTEEDQEIDSEKILGDIILGNNEQPTNDIAILYKSRFNDIYKSIVEFIEKINKLIVEHNKSVGLDVFKNLLSNKEPIYTFDKPYFIIPEFPENIIKFMSSIKFVPNNISDANVAGQNTMNLVFANYLNNLQKHNTQIFYSQHKKQVSYYKLVGGKKGTYFYTLCSNEKNGIFVNGVLDSFGHYINICNNNSTPFGNNQHVIGKISYRSVENYSIFKYVIDDILMIEKVNIIENILNNAKTQMLINDIVSNINSSLINQINVNYDNVAKIVIAKIVDSVLTTFIKNNISALSYKIIKGELTDDNNELQDNLNLRIDDTIFAIDLKKHIKQYTENITGNTMSDESLFENNLLEYDNDVNEQIYYDYAFNKQSENKQCYIQDKSVLELLISNNANINMTDVTGTPPISYAFDNQNLTNIKLLLKNNAKIDSKEIVNNAGMTPREYLLNNIKDHCDILCDENNTFNMDDISNTLYENVKNNLNEEMKNNMLSTIKIIGPMSIVMMNDYITNMLLHNIEYKNEFIMLYKSIGMKYAPSYVPSILESDGIMLSSTENNFYDYYEKYTTTLGNANITKYISKWKDYLNNGPKILHPKIVCDIKTNLLQNNFDTQKLESINLWETHIKEHISQYFDLPYELPENYVLSNILFIITHISKYMIFYPLYVMLRKIITDYVSKQQPISYDKSAAKSKENMIIVDKIFADNTLINYMINDIPKKIIKNVLKIREYENDPEVSDDYDSQYQDLRNIVSLMRANSTTSTESENVEGFNKLFSEIETNLIPNFKKILDITIKQLKILLDNYMAYILKENNYIKILKIVNSAH